MTLLTEVYDVTLKKDLRSAAKTHEDRPTIGQSFMSHKDYNSPLVTALATSSGTQIVPSISQNEFALVNHAGNKLSTISVEIFEFVGAGGGVTNNTLDFDLEDEAKFIQEDATNGTDFVGGVVKLHSAASGYTSDLCNNGTATASAYFESGSEHYTPAKAFDNSNQWDGWADYTAPSVNWLQYTFTTAEQINKLRILSFYSNGHEPIKDFTLQASATGSYGGEQVVLYTGVHPEATGVNFIDYVFANTTSYRYYRIVITSNWPGNGGNQRTIQEVEMMRANQSYPTTQPYYLTTTDTSQIALSNYVTKINSATITASTPTNTSITGLVSFDGRLTWKKWNGSGWVEASEVLSYGSDQCTGGTVDSSDPSNSDYAFDNAPYTNTYLNSYVEYVGSENATSWIQYRFSSIKRIEKVNIVSYYHGGYEAIKDFSIQASNTGVFGGEQVVLYTGQQPNGSSAVPGDMVPRPYTFTNNNLYMYYRIVITSNHFGNGGNNRIIQEIEMMEATARNTGLSTLQSGNTLAEIQTGLTNLTITDQTYLDFAFDLATTSAAVTPSIDQISINYDELGYIQAAPGSYSVTKNSYTQTKVTKLSTGTELNVKVNYVVN